MCNCVMMQGRRIGQGLAVVLSCGDFTHVGRLPSGNLRLAYRGLFKTESLELLHFSIGFFLDYCKSYEMPRAQSEIIQQVRQVLAKYEPRLGEINQKVSISQIYYRVTFNINETRSGPNQNSLSKNTVPTITSAHSSTPSLAAGTKSNAKHTTSTQL